MEGGFQKPLQLFVAYEYYMFEYDICVDLLDVLDGKPDYANAPFSKFVARACVDRLEVLDGKPGYANSPLPEFFARARCPPVLAPSRCKIRENSNFFKKCKIVISVKI